LRWDRPRAGFARGFSDEGYQLAQVAHVKSPDGAREGWAVLLLHPEGELFDQFDTPDEAMAAAEAAVDSNDELPTSEDG
jgi:hypothetical protein